VLSWSFYSFVFISAGWIGPDVLLRSTLAISSFCFLIIDDVLLMMFVDFGWLGQNWLSVLCFVWTDQNSLSLREWDVLRILLSANYKLYWSRGSLCSFTVLLFCTWWLLYVLFCSGQPKRNCISVSLALLYTFYGCFGWAEQNCSFVVSAFIGFSVFL
jgi:hypothetical protein